MVTNPATARKDLGLVLTLERCIFNWKYLDEYGRAVQLQLQVAQFLLSSSKSRRVGIPGAW